jgi:sec-independent protein translocase protein TatC
MRRYAILGIVALSAVVTPPDVFSMLSLVFPLVFLYEVSIWCVKLIEINRARDEKARTAGGSS